MPCEKENLCENNTKSLDVKIETEDCGTCGGLNTHWGFENFYRTVLRDKITESQLPPFDTRVQNLPFSTRGLLTINSNSENEEVVEYEHDGIPEQAGIITILKRGIHPHAFNLINNGEGGNVMTIDCDGVPTEVAPDYNNCNYMFEHLPQETLSRDYTAQDLNIFAQFTCCKPATKSTLGIVAVSVDPENPEFPIAVGINDFANCNRNIGIVRGLTKCVPEGEEIVVSWNDYASETNPGLVLIKNLEVEQIVCGDGAITETVWDGNTPQISLHADQRAFKNVYGSVVLSKNNLDSRALAADDYAGLNNPGIVKIKKVNINPTCNNQSNDDISECPSTPAEVIQKDDFANTTESGLVFISRELNNILPCPIVVTKHDFATEDNTGLVRVEDYCPQGDGWPIVPSMCTYSDIDKLGLTYQSVDTSFCQGINTDRPVIDKPIATSTNDKRNFHQVLVASNNYTDGGTGPGIIITSGDLPFSDMTIIENTSGDSSDINDGAFYCYEPMSDGNSVVITQDGWYDLNFIVKFRNTKDQLDTVDINTSTVTHSARIDINGVNSEIGDLNLIMTTTGDAGYNPADPRYGSPIRTCIADNSGHRFLSAGDVLTLRVGVDNLETYLLYAELSVECIQPNL